MTSPEDQEPTVRLAPAVEAWLDTYTYARPRWDSASSASALRQRVVAEAERVAAHHPDLPRSAVARLVARDTGLGEREVAAALA